MVVRLGWQLLLPPVLSRFSSQIDPAHTQREITQGRNTKTQESLEVILNDSLPESILWPPTIYVPLKYSLKVLGSLIPLYHQLKVQNLHHLNQF